MIGVISEVVLKKKKNAILYSQLEEYKRLFEIISRKDDNNNSKVSGNNQSKLSGSNNTSTQKGQKDEVKEIDFKKLDFTSQKLERQKMVLENLGRLLEKEKTRCGKLKKHLDLELLRQSPLEAEVKDVLRGYLKMLHVKGGGQLGEVVLVKSQEGKEVADAELYRTGLSAAQRSELVSLLLENKRVAAMLNEKLAITDRIRNMEEFEIDY